MTIYTDCVPNKFSYKFQHFSFINFYEYEYKPLSIQIAHLHQHFILITESHTWKDMKIDNFPENCLCCMRCDRFSLNNSSETVIFPYGKFTFTCPFLIINKFFALHQRRLCERFVIHERNFCIIHTISRYCLLEI